jgi:hypothetical protein
MNMLTNRHINALLALLEQAGVPALRAAFTGALVLFILAGAFIWRRRHQFFDPDPSVEDDVPVVRHNRAEAVLFVWGGLTGVLLCIAYQLWFL